MKVTVVHIHQKFYPYEGGSTQRLLNQLSFIDKSKYDIYVVSQKLGDEPTEEVYLGIKIYRYKHFFEIPLILMRLSKKINIDILHAHNYRPSFYTFLFNLFFKKKFVIEMHSIYSVKNRFNELLGKKLLSKADSIIVLSKKSRSLLINEFDIKQPINIIYNGVELKQFKHASSNILDIDKELSTFVGEPNRRKHIIVGYIGSLRLFQGIDNLVNIINNVKNKEIKFVVVGGTDQEISALRERISNTNVFLRSFVERDEAKHIYKTIDILLMPRPKMLSTDSALPLKPIEAIAAGNIIFSTDVGGMMELKEITKSQRIKFMSVQEMIETLNIMVKEDINKKQLDEGELEIFNIESQVKVLECMYSSLLERGII